jgi:hypothetical protein
MSGTKTGCRKNDWEKSARLKGEEGDCKLCRQSGIMLANYLVHQQEAIPG